MPYQSHAHSSAIPLVLVHTGLPFRPKWDSQVNDNQVLGIPPSTLPAAHVRHATRLMAWSKQPGRVHNGTHSQSISLRPVSHPELQAACHHIQYMRLPRRAKGPISLLRPLIRSPKLPRIGKLTHSLHLPYSVRKRSEGYGERSTSG